MFPYLVFAEIKVEITRPNGLSENKSFPTDQNGPLLSAYVSKSAKVCHDPLRAFTDRARRGELNLTRAILGIRERDRQGKQPKAAPKVVQ